MSLLRLHREDFPCAETGTRRWFASPAILLLSAMLFWGCGSQKTKPKPAASHESSSADAKTAAAKSPASVEVKTEEAEPDPLDRVFQELYDKVDFDGLNSLSEDEQVVYLVLRLRYEVLQGGLEYFFFNLAGKHARETVTALQKIGMPDAAAVLDEACELFPDHAPADEVDDRQIQLDEFTGDQRRQLDEMNVSLTKSLETAGEKVEYYLETHSVTSAPPPVGEDAAR